MRPALCVLALAVFIPPQVAEAQDSTTGPLDSARAPVLPAVEITVTRDPRAAALTAPYAISVSRRNPLDSRGQLQDVLAGLPGLFVANRNNPTQDPRIVIRGVGARTAFGVRGVEAVHFFPADLRRQEVLDQVDQRVRLLPDALFMSFQHRVVVQQ